MNLMLLAAGEGTRLRPYTLETPKPKIPFLTVPLAAYSLELLSGVSISNLVVNTHHLPDQIEDLFFDLNPNCKELFFSSESELLLGSGGGIHAAEPYLKSKESFFVANSDEVILPKDPDLIKDLMDFHKFHGGIATLLCCDHPGVGSSFGGAWTNNDSTKVELFSKTKTHAEHKGHHFVGLMLLRPEVFHYFKPNVVIENILYETLTLAMQQGEQVHVFNRDMIWFETGNPKDFGDATEKLLHLLETEDSWSRIYLENLIRKWTCRKSLIESTNPALVKKLEQVFRLRQIDL